MSDKSIGRELLESVGLGAALWAGGAAIFGAVEAMTNTATGLYQPIGMWAFAVGVYAVIGLLGGVAAGIAAFVWRRIPFLPRVPIGPLLGALFLGGLFFFFIGIPLNERALPDVISVKGLVGNGVFALVTAGVTVLLYFALRTRGGTGWVVAFVNLAVWLAVMLTVGDHIDTFVQPIGRSLRSIGTFSALVAACVVLYFLVLWALRALIAGTRSAVAPSVVLAVLVLLAVGLVTGVYRRGARTTAPPPHDKPNVLWLVMDTTRADHLSAYGYDRGTSPRLEKVADQGALFEEAYSESSWTIPGHFVMVTGRFDAGREKVLDDEFVTAAEVFRDAGYDTGAVLGNMSLGRGSGFGQGFDQAVDGPVRIFYLSAFEKIPVIKLLLALGIAPPDAVFRLLDRKTFLQNEAVRAGRINDDAIEWLDDRDPERPFFLFINYMDPHDAYDPPPEYRRKFASRDDPEAGFIRYQRKLGGNVSSNTFVRDVVPTLDARQWQEMVDLYDGEIAYLDAQIGRLLDALDERGLGDDTIVVIVADHGELFGEHGLANHFKALTREETHVPLLMRYPPAIAAGTRVRAPVQLRDILPTVLDMAGIGPAPKTDGQSLVSVLGGKTPGIRGGETVGFLYRPVDKEYPFTAPGHLLSVREEGVSQYVWSSTGMNQFYDLTVDPDSNVNRHGMDAAEAAAARRLEQWRKQAGFEDFGGKQKKVDRLMRDKLKALGYAN